MSEEVQNIVCPHCTSVNRIPGEKDARQAKCGHCHRPLFIGKSVPASAESFMIHIERNDIPVLVDFWAQWCGPCKMMAPVYDYLAREFEPEVRFLKVDADREAELASRYNVRSIPTLILFRKGAEIARQTGAMDAPMLRSWLRQHAAASPAFQAG